MLKKLCPLLIFFLSFYFSSTLIGYESTHKYFPSTLGSFWIFEDQDGNEFTRQIIETEEITGETYYNFCYEPVLEDWKDFHRYMHLSLFNVGEEWITFVVGDKIKKAVAARLTREMEIFSKLAKSSLENSAPAELNLTVDFNYNVKVEAEDQFNLLPIQTTPDEEWEATQINAKITMKFDIQGLPDFQNAADIPEMTVDFSIIETGKILGTETVETPAGTFEDCLKVEFKTETEMIASHPSGTGTEDLPGESVTTLWFAPNVGIVKFHQETEKIFLNMLSTRDAIETYVSDEEAAEITAPSVKTYELKKYEIASEVLPKNDNK
ncbi:MAG: hypothetical protein OXM61_17500 [Candidatus Poribacteria bacterium]|nr:hypothetical protein [Candidatus Poribacteria bacterium]